MDEVATQTGEGQDVQRLLFGSELMRPWIVANTLAFAIAGAIGGGVLRAIVGPWFGSDVSAIEAGRIQATGAALSSAIFWTIAGTAQWLVLRRAIRAGWWMPLTVLGWTASGALLGFSAGGSTSTIGPDAEPVSPLVTWFLLPPLFVLLIGGGQWLILRHAAMNTGAWALVNAGALFFAGFLGLSAAKMLPFITQYPSAQALAIVGAVSGPVYGWLSWQFLAGLRRRAH
jgi:hypothetical protein